MQFFSYAYSFNNHSKNLQVRIKVTPDTMTIAECNNKDICFGQYIIHFSKLKYSIEWKLNQDGQIIGGSIKGNSKLITQFEGQTRELLEFQQNIEGRIAFQKDISSFTIVQQLKETYFSDILLIEIQGEQRILKILDEAKGQKELEILKLLKTKTHPNILSLKNYWEENNQFSQYFIEIEYKTGGTLQHLIERYNGNVPKQIVKNIMMQLLEALQHLHQLNIIHRDIKCDNIVLDAQSETVYIIDFGLSIIREQYTEPVGTQGYIAPEIFNSYFVTFKQDIFSLGVVFHKLLFNQEVFSTFEENKKGIFNIHQDDIDPDARELLEVNDKLIFAILNMLELDPSRRFNSQDCLSAPYFIDEDNVLPELIGKLKSNNNCNKICSEFSTQTSYIN